ncbi:MAG: Flp pilus assembly protein CpaB [Gammaproteobacteria bacterium]|nr:Flp pilus assembly protein CpaB [Gammaproteobacteria bacterium]
MQRWLLLAGVVLGIISVVLVNVYIADVVSREAGIGFLRLDPGADPVARGEVLRRDSVVSEALPLRFEGLAQLVVRDDPQSRAFVLGRPVNRDLTPGSPLLYDYFTDLDGRRFAAAIEPGKRAIAIPVGSTSAVGFLIEPGSVVDILGTFPRLDASSEAGSGARALLPDFAVEIVTRTILQAVKVLAVDRAVSRGGYEGLGDRGFRSVTLEVTPEQAEILTFALGQVKGGLTLSLRHPDDLAPAELRGIDWSQLR